MCRNSRFDRPMVPAVDCPAQDADTNQAAKDDLAKEIASEIAHFSYPFGTEIVNPSFSIPK